MPISDLGHCKHKVIGFTLLEVMMVLVVVGISLVLVIPNLMKNDDDLIQEEAVRLKALMEYAADTANSRGLWLAWRQTETGYRFLQHDEEKNIWQPVINDDVLRERQIAEGLHLNAFSQQQAVLTTNTMIPFYPSGIHSPFQIILMMGEKKRILNGNLLGNIEILSSNLNVN